MGSNKVKSKAVPAAAVQRAKTAAGLQVGSDIVLEHSQPCWDFSLMDHSHAGKWDWSLSLQEHAEFLQFLRNMQASTWLEIERQTYNGRGGFRKKSNHSISADLLCKEAKDRLDVLGLGDQEDLFRFRLGTSLRVWGAFVGSKHQFHILWWDRDHQVYPLS